MSIETRRAETLAKIEANKAAQAAAASEGEAAVAEAQRVIARWHARQQSLRDERAALDGEINLLNQQEIEANVAARRAEAMQRS